MFDVFCFLMDFSLSLMVVGYTWERLRKRKMEYEMKIYKKWNKPSNYKNEIKK